MDPDVFVNGTFDGNSFTNRYSGLCIFDKFDAFRTDPLQPILFNETVTYNAQYGSNTADELQIAQLIGGYPASGQTANDASAVQWAIWETVQENTSNQSLFSGNVLISSSGASIATLADQYLTNAHTFAPAPLWFLTNSTRQDMVTWDGSGTTIPESASAGLAALSALFLLRRRL